MSPETVIIIPARYASTRYPGKPLVGLRGASGDSRTLIERSWRAALSVSGVDAVYVATDDERIADAARAFGANVVMTDIACANGTERCADALARLGIVPRVVVNLQGDALLTPAWFVSALISAIEAGAEVATPVLRLTPETYARFVDDRRVGRVGGTTAVMTAQGQALYFSKEVLPYTGRSYARTEQVPAFHHVGVYAYTPKALARYISAGACDLETLEGLEQLRFLYHGQPITCVEVDARGHEFWELNNPEDVARIEAVLRREGIA
ncbi:3-deoxy-manno-octulosonate cytidylyltransferase [Roseinatronobacter bogoriensis]|uniref:3-deoxy-manno-octulosonate cytidylyltransferase n=1 Tax=Roseinatronobacter bogoriensis subsp. barguzinensis TaxID=441209 RepID=A0A2K8KAH6_9RHOB|nr:MULTISPECIES: manno-octulosonate cytidylyltransferase [Rhodobaca]ATX64893.1 3-deoxy-manno-octulosonate cytidylyltransferase [Rhodobaca barguzinensis]MBB4208694.1 3-deoxy-manno-octulosonate cytidylyltransferase (CMP-KDO synthetase) [Rhodobaca bogoriensis DSM 18756]TDW38038.1 3-deoxy-manno-octulosonate cytidylyltransferase (CMP-KDO synthetase) [Rhodobaca barguzinensis]TDY69792.1 3-deoxy-manno-octulosonate cytidylyltransferase (CMP-KDO synthetase) [Rhodobaca bogoriensis DSM 18756]